MTDSITRRTYETVAREFAEHNCHMSPRLATAAQHFITLVRVASTNRPRIIDLGCGHGRDSAWLAEHGAVVTGVDLSLAMLRLAQRSGLDRVAQMDMQKLGISSGIFSGIWCNAAIIHLPKRAVPAALAEMRRTLIPGGILFLSLKEGAGQGFEPQRYVRGELPRFVARYRPDEAAELLSQTGWSIVVEEVVQGSSDLWLHYFAAN